MARGRTSRAFAGGASTTSRRLSWYSETESSIGASRAALRAGQACSQCDHGAGGSAAGGLAGSWRAQLRMRHANSTFLIYKLE